MQTEVGAVIIYDAAYEAYISEEHVPHSIYECEGAKTCAIELAQLFQRMQALPECVLATRSYQRNLKCRWRILDMTCGQRRHGTKFNGAPYIVQTRR